jgi:putative transcriptional regulator
MTEPITNLTNYLLVATPALDGTVFEKAVIYLCSHSESGAMGVVINNPIADVSFNEIMDSLDVIPRTGIQNDPIVYAGGPVEANRGFVLHTPDYTHESTMLLSNNASLSATADIVTAIAKGTGPKKMNFCLGYSGWDPGQLEREIAENDWLVLPADEDIVYNSSADKRYTLCVKKLGVDMTKLLHNAGSA